MKASAIMKVLVGTALAAALFFRFANIPQTLGESPADEQEKDQTE